MSSLLLPNDPGNSVNIASFPEMVQTVKNFEKASLPSSDNDKHHEMYPKFKDDFRKNVMALVEVFEKLGNPWKEKSGLHRLLCPTR